MFTKPRSSLRVVLFAAVLCSLWAVQAAVAGELQKPRILAKTPIVAGIPTVFHLEFENANASFELGEVFWGLDVCKKPKGTITNTIMGSVNVGKSETKQVTTEEITITEPGEYWVICQANSEANINGEQETTISIEVLPPPDCETPPTRTPLGMLVLTQGNTITYTAPEGCCYTIDPFINTGVWYDLSPSTKQTISDGQSVTFTVTAKDNKPLASVVAFAWRECEKGEPNGKDYIVITPRDPAPIADTSSPYPHLWGITFGDPVAVGSGNFVRHETDLVVEGIPQLTFSRYYDSRALDNGTLPLMGLNWQHSFSANVVIAGTTAVVTLESGRKYYFNKNGGNWTVDPGPGNFSYASADLRESAGTFSFTDIIQQKQYTFNDDGRVEQINDGRIPVNIAWAGADLVSASDGLGHTLSFTTDSLGRVTSVTHDSRTVDYTYSAASELTSVKRPARDAIDYAYSTTIPGQLTEISSLGSPLITNTYAANGRVISQTDAEGGLWQYAYGTGTSEITFPDGVIEKYTYDQYGRVTKAGPDGQQLSFTYGSNGMLTQVEGGEGEATMYEWLSSGLVASVTNGDGKTTYTYTPRTMNGVQVYDLTGISYPDGSSTAITHNGKGRQATFRNGAGGQWTYELDNNTGYRTSITDPLGREVQNEYSAAGFLTALTSSSGSRTTMQRNAHGNLTGVSLAGGGSIAIERDASGNITKHTDAAGNSVSYAYDGRGRLVTETFHGNAVVMYDYDNADRLTEVTTPTGDAWSYAYNDAGRLVSIHDPANNAISFNYDSKGDLTGILDRLGNELSLEYNNNKELIATVSALGLRTTYGRDAEGRVIGRTTPLGRTESILYTSRGDVASVTDGSGRKVEFLYDADRRVTVQTIGGMLTSSYEYDDAGSLMSITDPEGGTTTYTYDNAGRLSSIKDPADRTVEFGFDGRDRMSTLKLPGAQPTVFTYDADSRLTSIAYQNGPTYQYNYNAYGQITSTFADSVAYDADGRTIWSNGITTTWMNGNVASYGFDGTAVNVTYTYDAAGRVSSITVPGGKSTSFTYDADGRLLTVERPNNITTTYTYDDDGNVASIAEGTLTSIQLTYDNGGRITASQRSGFLDETTPMEDWSAAYDAGNARTDVSSDAVGRTTGIENSTAVFNDASQLISLSGDVSATFEYDGFGRMIKSTVNGVPVSYVWSDHVGDGIIGIVRRQGASQYVIPDPSGTVFMVIDSATGNVMYPHYTESGNVHAVTDQDGNVVYQWVHDPYGRIIAHGTQVPDTDYPFSYGGKSGSMVHLTGDLYATTARIYDAVAGRFVSHDPVRSLHAQNMNAFQYARQDPVNRQDWSGRAPGDAPQADDPYAGFSQEFRDRQREIEERYEREMKKIEEEFNKRREEREERAREERESRERIQRQQEEEDRRNEEDRQKLERAQEKVRQLNEALDPPPPPPAPPTPAPTGGGSSVPGYGGSSTNPGASGQPPAGGGTRTRGSGSGGGVRPPAPTPGTSGGSSGTGEDLKNRNRDLGVDTERGHYSEGKGMKSPARAFLGSLWDSFVDTINPFD